MITMLVSIVAMSTAIVVLDRTTHLYVPERFACSVALRLPRLFSSNQITLLIPEFFPVPLRLIANTDLSRISKNAKKESQKEYLTLVDA